MAATTIAEVNAEPLTVALTEPFGIATGAQSTAENVLVELRLEDGTMGIGEAAPFPAVNGETRDGALEAVAEARAALVGEDATRFRRLADILREACSAPTARCALESAVLDAFTRRAGVSLLAFFGGRETALTTDITVVTGSPDHAARATERAKAQGFTTLKVKVGGGAVEHDVARITAILDVMPEARLVLDANGAFDVDQGAHLVEQIGAGRIALFEQPTPGGDLDALRSFRKRTRVRVAADEIARSAADVAMIAAMRAADVVNVKISKCGVVEAADMIAAARGYSLGLMIGGMVETPLAMTVSACLAAGHGGFDFVDLDTPLFMKDIPMEGGFRQIGPHLDLSHIERGHGVVVTRRG
ncbi:MAG TPA: dipeptide epimerase [Polyangiaceae bacterium]|nr:dipeptide epimerase [Polyangiaceae bacterium]